MTTELFLGGLMILTVAAAIIVALTANNRSGDKNHRDRYSALRDQSVPNSSKR